VVAGEHDGRDGRRDGLDQKETHGAVRCWRALPSLL
jgi:hypothetical protein